MYGLEVFNFGKEAIDGFDLVFDQDLVAQFEVGDEVQDPGERLDIAPVIRIFGIDNQVEVVDSLSVVPTSELEARNFVIEKHDTVIIPIIGIAFDEGYELGHH